MIRIKHTLRLLKKYAGLSSINIFGMGLGLVSVAIIVGFVYQEYHYDTDLRDSDRIFRVIMENGDESGTGTYPPMAEALQSDFPEIESAVNINFFYGYLSFTTEENRFNEETVIFADPEFLSLFSFPIAIGNAETCLRDPESVVISQKAAQKYFGKENPVGKTLVIGGGSEYTVSAVYENFKPNSNFQGDIILPISKISKHTQVWLGMGWDYEGEINTFVKLSEDTSPEEFIDNTKDFIARYKPESDQIISLQPLLDIHTNNSLEWGSRAQVNIKYLNILLLVAGCILVISTVNFLFLYIGTLTQRKISTGLKKICGATKSSLFLDHFREVLTLIALSTFLGMIMFLLYNEWAINKFSFLPDISFFDGKILALLAGVIVMIAIITSLYPSLIIATQKPVEILQRKASPLAGRTRLIHVLVVGQFVLSISLIASTLLIFNQVRFMQNKDLGYDADRLISIPLNMHLGHGINNDRFAIFADELNKYTDISGVSMALSQPTTKDGNSAVPTWEGMPDDKHITMDWSSVYFDYFKTIGVEFVEGRDFRADNPKDVVNWDTRESAYILNERAVKELELDNPIGKTFEVWGFKGPIIGVVKNYNSQSLNHRIAPMFFEVNPAFLNEIIVRIDPSSPNVLANIESVWGKFVPEYPLEFRYVDDQIHQLYREEQNLTNILNIFSVLGILIACMGLLTLTFLSISQRTKEIGIRKVLGASVSNIVAMLSKEFLVLVLIGFIISIPIVWYAMNQWLQNYAYHIEIDPGIFVITGVSALAIALLTVSGQAIKAAVANPVESLKNE